MMRQKVFVGLSGGVDSAVSAALLKEQGHDVVGVFIKIWQSEFIECTWREDRLDAMRVAAALSIPFREIDLSDEYKKSVVEKMIADYARGATPNPDVLCNRHIKFGAFAKWAREEGAEMIATGHYAQKRETDAHFELVRGHDTAKDQSYFLYQLTQSDLSHALFPVGGMLKTRVREHAKRFKLPIAKKPDSQGVCFIGEVSMGDFLARFIPVERGAVLDTAGKVVGEHSGAALYTIGQRHGFVTAGPDGPYYVVRIDVASNTLHVSQRREDAARASVTLEDVHWVYREPHFPCTLQAQTRHHERPVTVELSKNERGLVAAFLEPHIASPGQSLVLYLPALAGEGDACVGGGTIK